MPRFARLDELADRLRRLPVVRLRWFSDPVGLLFDRHKAPLKRRFVVHYRSARLYPLGGEKRFIMQSWERLSTNGVSSGNRINARGVKRKMSDYPL
jgi:hypothetical protein